MVETRKFSEFPSGTLDEAAGLASGVNTRGPVSGGGGGGGPTLTVPQANDFSIGEWIRFNGSLYVRAQADNSSNAETIGVVIAATSVEFTVQQSGYIEDLTSAAATYVPMTPGQAYFLSPTTAGLAQLSDVNTLNQVSRPVLLATSTTGGWVYPYRGQIQGNGTFDNDVGNFFVFEQPGAGFSLSNIIRVDGPGTFALALSDTASNSQAIGFIVELNVDGNPDKYKVQTNGYSNAFTALLSSYTPNTLLYLSDTIPGAMTNVPPASPTSLSKPVAIVLNDQEAFILDQRQLPNQSFVGQQFVFGSGNFGLGEALRISAPNTWTLAIADSLVNARASGLVVWRDGTNFILQTEGYTDKLGGVSWNTTQGAEYYLSASSPGELTTVEPTAPTFASKPMFTSINATEGIIREERPMLQPGANGGGGMSDWTLLTTKNLAGVRNVVFDNTEITGYDEYLIRVTDMVGPSGGYTILLMSADNGSTWKTSYQWFQRPIPFGSSTVAPHIELLLSGVANLPGAGEIIVRNMNHPSQAAFIHANGICVAQSPGTALRDAPTVGTTWPFSSAFNVDALWIGNAIAGLYTSGTLELFGRNF